MSKKENNTPRLLEKYKKEIVPAIIEKFGVNIMEIPKLDKISISMGIGNAKDDPKDLQNALEDIRTITGQQPVVTKAKKAISNFKIRQGDPVGCFVTLRKEIMYEFFDRLISTAIPRIKDFSGLSDKSFDGRGNYSFGILEHTVFPEIKYENVDKIRGMNITINTTAETDEVAYEFFKLFGFPFKKRQPVSTEKN